MKGPAVANRVQITPDARPTRSDVYCADLLRAWVEADALDDLGLRSRLAQGLGFAARPADRKPDPYDGSRSETIDLAGGSGTAKVQEPAMRGDDGTDERPPLRAQILVPLRQERIERSSADDSADTTPLEQDIWDSPPDTQQSGTGTTPPLTLLRASQWWPALRDSASVVRPAGIDLRALVSRLSLRRPVRRLPRQQRRLWSGQLWLVADISERMDPYAEDLCLLVRLLLKMRGEAGLTVLGAHGRPDALSAEDAAKSRRPPPPGTVVVLFSDMGWAAHPGRGVANPWIRYAKMLQERGCIPVCWAPVAPAQVSKEAAALVDVRCLLPGAGLKSQRGQLATPEQARGERARLEDLRSSLDMLASCAVYLDSQLLRRLRWLDPALRAQPALESVLWGDRSAADDGLGSRSLQAEAAAQARRQASAALPAALWLAMLDVLHGRRAELRRSLQALEASLWAAHSPVPVAAAGKPQRQWVEQGLVWTEWLAELASRSADFDPMLRDFARDVFHRQGADQAWLQHRSRLGTALWAATGQASVPAGVSATQLLAVRARRRPQPVRGWRMDQRGTALWLMPADAPPVRHASPVAGPFEAGELAITVTGGRTRLIRPAETGQVLIDIGEIEGRTLTVESATHCIDVALRESPPWATGIGRDAEGAFVRAPPPDGQEARLGAVANDEGLYWLEPIRAVVSGGSPLGGARAASPRLDEAAHFYVGAEPSFPPCGLYAELHVRGVTQRLRYIPPGTFWMGSPDREPDREQREGPRHPVRITQGFWLADTACTQALWLAVMGGKNPARFQDDPRNPVENVSWDDVQRFLQSLQKLLPPGCSPALPTEAEWEYACRAGTNDPFSWGTHIDSTQVNFDGTEPYDDGPSSGYRQRTVPVASLPPNPWGLYEMHGNVWEWCDDSGIRRYEASDEPIDDPRDEGGAGATSPRALRGGAWFGDARDCRSAIRVAFERGYRYDYVGFRLALRSSSTSPAPAQVLGAPEAPRFPGRDGPGTAARRDAEPPRSAAPTDRSKAKAKASSPTRGAGSQRRK